MSTRYEYKRILCREDRAEAELNRLGAAGWQLLRFELTVGPDPDATPVDHEANAKAVVEALRKHQFGDIQVMPNRPETAVTCALPAVKTYGPPMMIGRVDWVTLFVGYMERTVTA